MFGSEPNVAKELLTGLFAVESNQEYSGWIYSPLSMDEFITHFTTVKGASGIHSGW